jgi:hypothetical protein
MGKLAQKLGGQSQSQVQTKSSQSKNKGAAGYACGGVVKKGKK